MRVCVLTDDKYLFRLVQLRLFEKCETVIRFDALADTVIYDCDSDIPLPDTDIRIIKVSRRGGADALALPLPSSFFAELLSGGGKPALSLSDDGRHAILNGEAIKLTALEASLLSLLLDGGEDYTPRQKIAREVFGSDSDGLINVYVHYLREKLEKGGERVILSSRKYGYKINPVYVGEGTAKKGELP